MGWPANPSGLLLSIALDAEPIQYLFLRGRRTGWGCEMSSGASARSAAVVAAVFRVYQGTWSRQGFVRGTHSGSCRVRLRKTLPDVIPNADRSAPGSPKRKL